MTARNAAEANIAGIGFGNADGTNKSSSQMGVAVGDCLAGGRTISFAFDADPFSMSCSTLARTRARWRAGPSGFRSR